MFLGRRRYLCNFFFRSCGVIEVRNEPCAQLFIELSPAAGNSLKPDGIQLASLPRFFLSDML